MIFIKRNVLPESLAVRTVTRKALNVPWRGCHHNPESQRAHHENEVHRIRNIGILAHIDAGKTTTTERMLFYSGKIRSMGEVHHGNTVTDFMEQERNRGITITSASVSFSWKDHRFNLVDTPGHIDFTYEVEQSLNVLDGAVVVLDASAGVEAQTQTVWRQADRFKIPRIVYANKMDRADADLALCVETLQEKLNADVVVTQLPINSSDKKFIGVVDLLTLHKLIWTRGANGGEQFNSVPLETATDGDLLEEAIRAREDLTDQLSGMDDSLAEEVISQESLEKVSSASLRASLRRVTILQKAVPLLCGSSYKNVGVQPLMDAVIRFLPSPVERSNKLYQSAFDGALCAQAFKVMHHPHLGALVFFRLYTGEMKKGQKIYNMRTEQAENSMRLLVATADDFEEVNSVHTGYIAVINGLNETRTGDLVTSTSSVASKASKSITKLQNITEDDARKLLGIGATPPDPVFFCSIEASSQGQQVGLDKALVRLQREDPSLFVSYNEETCQTILGGMGELHLDIIKERIRSEYKLDVLIGPLQIAYKEILNGPVDQEYVLDHTIGSSKQFVKLNLSVIPMGEKLVQDVLLLRSPEKEENLRLQSLSPRVVSALRQGVTAGLLYGPKLNCPLMAAYVNIRDVTVGKGTSQTMVSAAASQGVRKALQQADTSLMEPIMRMEVVTSEKYLPIVVPDLSRRRGSIQSIDIRMKNRVVDVKIPLVEVLGYAKDLRAMTSGTAVFSMEFSDYSAMTSDEELNVLRKEGGY